MGFSPIQKHVIAFDIELQIALRVLVLDLHDGSIAQSLLFENPSRFSRSFHCVDQDLRAQRSIREDPGRG